MNADLGAITAHLEMLHMQAKATGAVGTLVLVGYGEDPNTGEKLSPRVKPFPIGEVTRMVDQAMAWTVLPHVNVYVAPVVMRPDLPAGSRGGKHDIVQVFALVADYDDDDAANWPTRVPIPPSYVLETSPGRFQTGFFLDPVDCAQADALAKRLQATAQCDSGTGDIDHVWRIDGTLNWPNKKKAKAGRSLAPVLVRMVPGGTGAVVRDLEARLGSGKSKKAENNGDGHRKAKPITADDKTQLKRMFASKNGAEIRALYDGDLSAYPSHSEADSALCFHLAFWFGKDQARMDQLVRQSGLMREKWDSTRGESTYGADVIASACATVTDTYTEPDATTTTAVLVRLADVEPENVSWLWTGRIALGKVNLLIGPPGVGKSYLTLDMAARHSRGSLWADRLTCPQGGTILLGAEDGMADTIRPRLDGLGADVTQIHALTAVREKGTERGFDLSRDVAWLREAVQATKATLVIIDPLTAYLGKTESYKDAEVRAVLAPLATMADQERVAVVCVMHLNKSATATVLNRASGSIAFTAAARTAFGVGLDPNNPERHLFLSLKMNLGAHAPTLAFQIGPKGLTWEEGPVMGVTHEQVFGMPAPVRREQTAVRDFLRELLKDGPLNAKQIFKDGKENGFSQRQLHRAADAEGVKKHKMGMKEGWVWTVPR